MTIEVTNGAVYVTDYLGGLVDNNVSMCHGPTVLGIQQAGIPSCTIGQMKNRADTVVFWGTNPMESHPCHESKRSVFPLGFFRKRGRNDRKIIVADPRVTNTAKQADLYVKVKPNYDLPLFNAMRAVLRGYELNEFTETTTGVKVDKKRGSKRYSRYSRSEEDDKISSNTRMVSQRKRCPARRSAG